MAAPWRDRAACQGEPTVLFFPARGKPERVSEELCGRCSVQEECLDFGYGERHGVWGGRRHSDRRADLEAEEVCEGCGDGLPAGRWRWCSHSCAELFPIEERHQDAEEASCGAVQMRLPLQAPRPLSAPLGPTLAYERLSRGETRAEAAVRCGVTEARWGLWEDGVRCPEIADVVALARWLHCSTARVVMIAELPWPGGARRIASSRPGHGLRPLQGGMELRCGTAGSGG